MKELLMKWVELETESRCRINYDLDAVEFRLSTDRLLIVPLDLEPEQYSDELLAYIQFAIQDAITSKGWDYSIESFLHSPHVNKHCKCYVLKPDYEPGDPSYNANFERPAEGLLAAYLKALEADEMEEAA